MHTLFVLTTRPAAQRSSTARSNSAGTSISISTSYFLQYCCTPASLVDSSTPFDPVVGAADLPVAKQQDPGEPAWSIHWPCTTCLQKAREEAPGRRSRFGFTHLSGLQHV